MDVRAAWQRQQDHLAFRTCPRQQPGGAPGHLTAGLAPLVVAQAQALAALAQLRAAP